MKKPFLERLRDDEFIDEIHLRTVPRFKTSELSGDEWRTFVEAVAYRKGREVGRRSWSRLEWALPRLQSWIDDDLLSPIDDPDMTADLCMQPGCAEPYTVEYQIVKRGCSTCGHVKAENNAILDHRRRFCDRHAHRGNASLSDSDDNYTAMDGGAPARAHVVRDDDRSPAAFGGVVILDSSDG